MPGMTNSNNIPWWAPGRPLIISDPTKLTYFARANAVRAGVQGMPGALSGVAVGDSNWANPFAAEDSAPGDMRAGGTEQMFDPTLASGNRLVPTSIAMGSNEIGATGVETPSGGRTLDSFFNSLNNWLRGPAPNPYGPAPSVAPSPWPWVVGAGAIGVVLLMLAKRRRS